MPFFFQHTPSQFCGMIWPHRKQGYLTLHWDCGGQGWQVQSKCTCCEQALNPFARGHRTVSSWSGQYALGWLHSPFKDHKRVAKLSPRFSGLKKKMFVSGSHRTLLGSKMLQCSHCDVIILQ